MATFNYDEALQIALEKGELEELLKGEGDYYYDDKYTNGPVNSLAALKSVSKRAKEDNDLRNSFVSLLEKWSKGSIHDVCFALEYLVWFFDYKKIEAITLGIDLESLCDNAIYRIKEDIFEKHIAKEDIETIDFFNNSFKKYGITILGSEFIPIIENKIRAYSKKVEPYSICLDNKSDAEYTYGCYWDDNRDKWIIYTVQDRGLITESAYYTHVIALIELLKLVKSESVTYTADKAQSDERGMDTIRELEQYMEKAGYNFNSISIGNHVSGEGEIFTYENGTFFHRHSERGYTNTVATFTSGKEFYKYVINATGDIWYQAHLYKSTQSLKEIKSTEKLLKEAKYYYERADIENYKDGKTLYRIFLFGNDYRDVVLKITTRTTGPTVGQVVIWFNIAAAAILIINAYFHGYFN